MLSLQQIFNLNRKKTIFSCFTQHAHKNAINLRFSRTLWITYILEHYDKYSQQPVAQFCRVFASYYLQLCVCR